MNATTRSLFDTALQLPDSERAELAAWLIESLEGEFDEEVEATWAAEIGQRVADLESGKISAVPWADARRMILGQTDGSTTD